MFVEHYSWIASVLHEVWFARSGFELFAVLLAFSRIRRPATVSAEVTQRDSRVIPVFLPYGGCVFSIH